MTEHPALPSPSRCRPQGPSTPRRNASGRLPEPAKAPKPAGSPDIIENKWQLEGRNPRKPAKTRQKPAKTRLLSPKPRLIRPRPMRNRPAPQLRARTVFRHRPFEPSHQFLHVPRRAAALQLLQLPLHLAPRLRGPRKNPDLFVMRLGQPLFLHIQLFEELLARPRPGELDLD